MTEIVKNNYVVIQSGIDIKIPSFTREQKIEIDPSQLNSIEDLPEFFYQKEFEAYDDYLKNLKSNLKVIKNNSKKCELEQLYGYMRNFNPLDKNNQPIIELMTGIIEKKKKKIRTSCNII